jgi:plastocyanin
MIIIPISAIDWYSLWYPIAGRPARRRQPLAAGHPTPGGTTEGTVMSRAVAAVRNPYAGTPPALLALLAAVLLALPVRAADAEFVLTIQDHHFVPPELTVPAGQKLKLVVRNADAVAAEFESVDFHREKLVQGGHEIAVFVGPLEAGSYEFFDDLHPETRGHLIVR